MVWVTAVIGLVGAWGLLAGTVLLGREARVLLAAGESTAEGVTVDATGRALLGVALLVAGTVIVYVALALGGYLAPW